MSVCKESDDGSGQMKQFFFYNILFKTVFVKEIFKNTPFILSRRTVPVKDNQLR